jgi:hypothetical protein
MVRTVKPPQPWNLVVQAVVPILSKIIGNGYNNASPEEWHPVKTVFKGGQHKW